MAPGGGGTAVSEEAAVSSAPPKGAIAKPAEAAAGGPPAAGTPPQKAAPRPLKGPSTCLGLRPLLYVRVADPTVAEGLAAGEAAEALLVLSQGSVVDFAGDAIVNAANTGCLYGGGVDGAIADAGGEELARAREALPVLDRRGTRCPTGEAKLTVGGALRAKWCVHAVGPNYCLMSSSDFAAGDELLRQAYAEALRRAQEARAETVAFSLLSAGVFKGRRSLEDVLQIGVAAIESGVYPKLREVHLVAFTNAEVLALEAAARRVWQARGAEVLVMPVR